MAVLENRIVIGPKDDPIMILRNDGVMNITVNQAVAMVGQELSIDTLEFTVFDNHESVVVFAPADYPDGLYTAEGSKFAVSGSAEEKDIASIPYGTTVRYYNDNDLVGKFYVTEVQRSGKNSYKITASSFVGLLDKTYHGGGLYNGMSFAEILADILADDSGGSTVSYTVTDDVAELTCSGWLPHDTRRNNLYQLLVANGVNIVKGADGDPIFTFIYSGTPSLIPASRTYIGGSITYSKSASEIDVTEHDFIYIEGEEDDQTLFDNSTAASVANQQVWFNNAPIVVDSLTATGLTFTNATVNGCVVTGQGTLTGKPYSHTLRVVKKPMTGVAEEKVISVSDATMVNATNSENLLNRLAAYYGSTIDVDMDIKMEKEKCGSHYEIEGPFGDLQTAFLQTMDVNVTGFKKATCTFIVNYEPSGQRGLYTHCVVLDKDTYEESGGVFTTPEGIESMKVVIIGGGTGGTSGYPGENGNDTRGRTNYSQDKSVESIFYGARGGKGGEGGEGGSAGRIFTVTIDNPGASYNYTIGEGGAGGESTGFIPDTESELKSAYPDATDSEIATMLSTEAALTDWAGTPNAGEAGTASTFGSYSSDDTGSFVPTTGYYNPLDGNLYATNGESGITGGHGGAYEKETGETTTWICTGENVSYNGIEYEGGSVGENVSTVKGLSEAIFTAYGGNGAGAAVGVDHSNCPHMDGGDAPDATWKVTENG